MCGIAGIINLSVHPEIIAKQAQRMISSLHHRGPDHEQIMLKPMDGLALAHRRLSIIDTSKTGNQPMTSKCGRYILTYNGEIYNFQELKAELASAGQTFVSTSDTEVFLETISAHGIDVACKMANGMFAFAVWDRTQKRLTLGRDRFGQKPLFYGVLNGGFYFASELKAFAVLPELGLKQNFESLSAYFQYGYIPAPLSIYERVMKLAPSTLLTYEPETKKSETRTYWAASKAVRNSQQMLFSGSNTEAREYLSYLLRLAISQCMISDVPLGAFLSGGIDSTAISAMMVMAQKGAVKTYSIGFEDTNYDESTFSSAVARHLGTDHTEFRVTQKDVFDTIPILANVFDEPFSDPSMIPTFLVSKLAKSEVSVVLSGDGGDELFGGYNRHLYAQNIARLTRLPWHIRAPFVHILKLIPLKFWSPLLSLAPLNLTQIDDKIHKMTSVLAQHNFCDAYQDLVTIWPEAMCMVSGDGDGVLKSSFLSESNILMSEALSPSRQMMLSDTLTYLPGDVLAKVDRASMASSLEVRAPLLDHRIFDFVWSLPEQMLLSEGVGKRLLRDVVYEHVPKQIMDRPKMGFSLPLADWLRGPLREWSESLLENNSLEDGGLNARQIRIIWDQHLKGHKNWQSRIWTILMYRLWEETWLKR